LANEQPFPYSPNAFEFAFNVLKSGFWGSKLFDVVYNDGKTVLYGPTGDQKTYLEPDGIEISPNFLAKNTSETVSIKTASDYDRKFSTDIEGKYSGITYSGSLSSSLAFQMSLTESDDSETFMNAHNVQTYTVRRHDELDYRTQDFLDAIEGLPSSISGSDLNSYFDFFENYGTHYFKRGAFGGSFFMKTVLSNSTFSDVSSTEIEVALDAGFRSAVQSGEMSEDTVVNSNDTLKKYVSSSAIDFSVVGGSFTYDIVEYTNSVYTQPFLILNAFGATQQAELTPISELADDADIKDFILQALQLYLLGNQEKQDGIIGTAFPIETETNYSNLKYDFMVLVSIQTSDVLKSSFSAEVQPSGAALAERGTGSIDYNPGLNAFAQYDSFSTMLALDETYTGRFSPPGEAIANQWAVPIFNNNETLIDDIGAVNLNTEITAVCDGILVVDGNYSNGDDTFSDTAIVKTGASSSGLSTVAACSLSVNVTTLSLSARSCLVPILAGNVYSIETSSGSSGAASSFSAVCLNLKKEVSFFGVPQVNVSNTDYTATQDGLLLILGEVADDGDTGHVNCTLTPSVGLDVQNALALRYYVGNIAAYSINASTQSLCVPVAKGTQYRFSDEPIDGTIKVTGSFFPFDISEQTA
jgi:hypothetical protein